MRFFWMAWLLACGAACAQQPDSSPAQGAARSTAEQIDQRVAWPAAVDQAARSALSAEARAAVDGATMPVLLVATDEVLPVTNLVVKDRFYAQSARREGLTVSLHGTRTSHAYPGLGSARGNRSVRGHDALVTQNEGIWSAAWIEGEVAYVVEVECQARDDARCLSEHYVLELAEAVRFVGPVKEAAP
jgi:hypothetical protein